MSKKKSTSEKREKELHRTTPTFLLELALQVNAGQAKRIRAHLEAGRALYNAVLAFGQRRSRQMRADKDWQTARAIPRTHKAERRVAFSALRAQYGFSEYALHDYAKRMRVCQSVAETLWQERGASSTRDVCSIFEAHRCKYGRRPDR